MVLQKKAQSALEFLTTYGWAFLVILIMIGALSYFGVLDPSRFLPDKCLFSNGVGGCTDYGVTSAYFAFKVVNNFGKDVTITTANASISGLATVCSTALGVSIGGTNYATATGRTWPSNTEANFSNPCTIATGERVLAKITMQVLPVGSTYPKEVTGDFSVRKI